MATQVILLERIEKLGKMGEVVSVKPGFARNFLLPQGKALRATESNIAYFQSQKSALEKVNNEKKAQAEQHTKALKGLTVSVIRQAGEAGQLYGSVTARDVADAINEKVSEKIARNTVELHQAIKEIGLFPVTIVLHPEVKIDVTINVARTEEEAKKQLKSGKAVTGSDSSKQSEVAQPSKAALMEEGALKAEEEEQAKSAEKAAEEEAKSKAKSEERKAKKAAKAAEEEAPAAEAQAE